MPSVNALAIMALAGGGAFLAGRTALRHSQQDPSFDTTDRIGYTASAGIAGAAGALALGHIGVGRFARGAMGLGKAAAKVGRYGMKSPRGMLGGLMGRKIPIPKAAMKATGALALFAAAVGGVAVGSRTPNQQEDMAYRDESGGYTTSSMGVRERMGLLGATGDMVFGLNNLRHG